MKRLTNINQILALFIALFVVTAFSACSDVAGPGQTADDFIQNEKGEINNIFHTTSPSGASTSETYTYDITAGKNKTAGVITVTITDSEAIVEYQMTGDWWVKATHLDIFNELDTSSNAPANGSLRYGDDNITPGAKSISYNISFVDAEIDPDADIFIVAHAEVFESESNTNVKNAETAYGGDTPAQNKGNWWYYIEIGAEPSFNGRAFGRR